MTCNKYDIIVVGGGAAGLLAGVLAGQNGMKVLICERLAKPGRKLLVTGGGRCNLSRFELVNELITKYYGKKNFVRTALYNFEPQRLMEYFKSLGVTCVVAGNGGIYPASNKAQDVFNALIDEYKKNGGEITTGIVVDEILRHEGCVAGVRCGAELYMADSVILAAGGKGVSELGADGSGFLLAEHLGHTLVAPVPALVPLVAKYRRMSALAGLSVDSCTVTVNSDKHKSLRFAGDLLFTHKGISGPVVLNASGVVSRKLISQNMVELSIQWSGNIDFWEDKFSLWREDHGAKRIDSLLFDYFSKRFVTFLLEDIDVSPVTIMAELKKHDRDRLLRSLVDFKLQVTATEGFAKSMVTSGGIALNEIKTKTLESKLVEGLYVVGEVLDVDGECGGYNLQWAFASAMLAVKSIRAK